MLGFKVKQNDLMKPKYYALQAYEDNKGPLDRLMGKTEALDLIKNHSILDSKPFFEVTKFMHEVKLEILDPTPIFEFPLSERSARLVMLSK